MADPDAGIPAGRARRALRRDGPAPARSRPARIARSDDFPAPFRPVTTRASPPPRAKERSWKMRRPDRRQARLSTLTRTCLPAPLLRTRIRSRSCLRSPASALLPPFGLPFPTIARPGTQSGIVPNRVAARCEMIYSTLGCAARHGVQSASRAYPLSGRPRSGARFIAHSAEQPVRLKPHDARIYARDCSQQLQLPARPCRSATRPIPITPSRRPRRTALRASPACPSRMKVLLENLLRYEDGRTVTKADIEAVADWLDNKGKAENEIAYPPGPRPDAGLHRRAGRGRPRRDARRHGGARRRPAQDQPAGAGRSRHRPFRRSSTNSARRSRFDAATSSSNTSATASATTS